MATAAALSSLETRRDWPGALRAVRLLLADPDDTVQVFRIMAALNSGTSRKNYHRLIATPEGGRIAYRRVELVARLTDRAFLAQFAEGTVGAAYRAFLDKTGFSADGLADVSKLVERDSEEHPYAWFGRRERDIHDIWHVLTGYQANDPLLGELCLRRVLLYAQSGGLGLGLHRAGRKAIKALGERGGLSVIRAIREGHRHGRAAAWLHGEATSETLCSASNPLDAARARLNIAAPAAYLAARQKQAGLSAAPAVAA